MPDFHVKESNQNLAIADDRNSVEAELSIKITTFVNLSSYSSPCCAPYGTWVDLGVSGMPANYLEEVFVLATVNPLCYLSSFFAKLQTD